MRKFFHHLAWGLCCAWVLAGHGLKAAPILVPGDDGYSVALKNPAQRIISLAPHLTELLYAAGAGEKLVAVSAYSDFPEAAKLLPRVGDASNLDLERIVTLKPDLILAWKSNVSPFAVERLRNLSIPVYVSETHRLAGIPILLRNIGALAGTAINADRAATKFETELLDLTRAAQKKTIVPTFIEIWHDPLLSVNGDHIMSEIVASCGGRNILENLPILTPSIGLEALLEANPGAIIGGGSAVSEAEFQRAWLRHRSIRAVQRQMIFYVNPDWIQRATPRILFGAKVICDGLETARLGKIR